MKSNDKYKPKFFPFSAGIPWKIERGKYIIPSIDRETWHKVLDDKTIVIAAYGSYLESYFSLSVAEMFAKLDPNKKVYWIGNSKYEMFASLQGLCKPCNINLTKNEIDKYPVPLFFDKKDNAYFNVLNNYLIKTSYWGLYPKMMHGPILKQIFENVMVPWNGYIPKMRNLGTDYFDELVRTGVLKDRSRIITLILNNNISDVLNWNIHNIKEFAQLVYNKGFRLVVFSTFSNLFHGTKVISCDFDIRKMLQILSKSWMAISNDIHFSLISMMASDCKILGAALDGPMNLVKNAEFLDVHNDIFSYRDWISPLDAYTICEGLL